MMHCEKTGCLAYIQSYDEYVYGDAHRFGPHLVLRIVQRIEPHALPTPNPKVHYVLRDFEEWFDKGLAPKDGWRNSTLIASSGQFDYLGYEGKELNK